MPCSEFSALLLAYLLPSKHRRQKRSHAEFCGDCLAVCPREAVDDAWGEDSVWVVVPLNEAVGHRLKNILALLEHIVREIGSVEGRGEDDFALHAELFYDVFRHAGGRCRCERHDRCAGEAVPEDTQAPAHTCTQMSLLAAAWPHALGARGAALSMEVADCDHS
jgi:ferredoxin